MNNFSGYDDRIEKFLRGEMSHDEEEQFKKDIKTNPDLKERAEAISSLIRGLKRKGRKDDSIIIKGTSGNNLQKDSKAAAEIGRRKYKRIIAWTLSFAAVLVLLYNIFSSNNNENINLSPYYDNSDMSEICRGEEDSTIYSELTSIFEEIKDNKNCTEQVKRLETIYNSLDKDYKYRDYCTDITWNLALAYIKLGKKDNAKKLLKEIILNNPDTELSEKSKQLLKTLQKK